MPPRNGNFHSCPAECQLPATFNRSLADYSLTEFFAKAPVVVDALRASAFVPIDITSRAVDGTFERMYRSINTIV